MTFHDATLAREVLQPDDLRLYTASLRLTCVAAEREAAAVALGLGDDPLPFLRGVLAAITPFPHQLHPTDDGAGPLLDVPYMITAANDAAFREAGRMGDYRGVRLAAVLCNAAHVRPDGTRENAARVDADARFFANAAVYLAWALDEIASLRARLAHGAGGSPAPTDG